MIPFLSFAVLILSIILHEVAHGYAADSLGDPTARFAGRLTLNPLPHIDPMGSVIIPAIFPEQLANDHIISWSNEGDLVYDPFMGSGTTAKMAIINKRNWIGSEISKEYCDIAEQRLKQEVLL
jgi:DNA modification methylase